MDTTTFAYNDGEVTVRARRVRDELRAEVLGAVLSKQRPDDMLWGVRQFARLVTEVEDADGVLPFAVPEVTDTEAILAAYDAFMDADAGLLEAWGAASNALDTGKADTAPATTPPPSSTS